MITSKELNDRVAQTKATIEAIRIRARMGWRDSEDKHIASIWEEILNNQLALLRCEKDRRAKR